MRNEIFYQESVIEFLVEINITKIFCNLNIVVLKKLNGANGIVIQWLKRLIKFEKIKGILKWIYSSYCLFIYVLKKEEVKTDEAF